MNKRYESFPLTDKIIEKLNENEPYFVELSTGEKRCFDGGTIYRNNKNNPIKATHILVEVIYEGVGLYSYANGELKQVEQPLPSKTAGEAIIENKKVVPLMNFLGRPLKLKTGELYYKNEIIEAVKKYEKQFSSSLQPSTVGGNHNDSAIKKKQFNISPEELKDISSEKVLVIDGNSFYREDYMFYLMGKWKSSPVSLQEETWIEKNPHCKQEESCSQSLTKKCICPKNNSAALPKQEEDKSKVYFKELHSALAHIEGLNIHIGELRRKLEENQPAALPSDEQLKDEVLNILNNILESDPAFGGFVCHKEKAAKKIVEWLSSHKQPGSDVVKFPRLKTENYRGAEWLAQLEGMSIIAQGKTEEEAINELMVSIKTKLLFDRNNQSAPELPKEETK